MSAERGSNLPANAGSQAKAQSENPARKEAVNTKQPLSGDWRLLPAEIRASSAYARALVGAGVLTEAERDSLIKGLKQIETDVATEREETDDLFGAIDARLAVIAGPLAGKLNAGRSRNEQAVTALRLWLLEEMEGVGELMANVQRALIEQAEQYVGALMPGYTHFQPAGAVSCSHWLMSFFWMLARDQERLIAAISRTAVSPLGSGSLAGTPYQIDRKALAAELGFSDVTANSMDAVGDLDFAAEFLFIAALIGVHLSRLAEDLILYSNPALGFVTVAEEYTSGSSLMPLKRNPEAVELSRGKAARLLGELAGFLSALKALPSTYNHDTQESRGALFEAVDLLVSMLTILEGVIGTLEIHTDAMREALDERVFVADLADYLVMRGIAYQEAYQIVETLSHKAEDERTPLSEMPLEDFQAESEAFDADVFAVFDYARSASQRSTPGGTAPSAIRTQIRQALDWLMEAGLE